MKQYYPETFLISTEENRLLLSSKATLKDAWYNGKTLEARAVMCDKDHNLHVDLGAMRGRIPREEGALGIEDGSVRDIALISRVNKPVQFYVTGFESDIYGEQTAVLSRRQVQRDCYRSAVSALRPGDVIDATVTHTEGFGAFADIGAGLVALLPIDAVSVSRIPHPNVRFSVNLLISRMNPRAL